MSDKEELITKANALIDDCKKQLTEFAYTQSDMGKAIEQVKRETAEKCAEKALNCISEYIHNMLCDPNFDPGKERQKFYKVIKGVADE